MAATAASSSMTGMGTTKVCFNSNCKGLLERPCKGWRRRTGEFAELCDRCESAYKGGNFCETFHLNSSGWRCCESCGKQIHCGCIVSFHMFVLLDAGGIECITCARKSFIMTPNPAWPPPSLLLPVQPERIKDISARNWTPIAGSGPVPWRQAPSVFNGTSVQHQLQPRMPTDADRHRFNERLSSFSVEKRKMEDSFDKLMNGSLKISCSSVLGVGKSVEQPCSSLNHFQQTAYSTTSGLSLAVDSTSKTEADDQSMVAGTTAHLPTLSQQAEKQSCSQNQVDVSEGQPCNGKAKGDILGRGQLLPRYWPRISEEELQKISEVSNSVITPLFEKMLSASDAGRIGRLVLPKKCAEAYFPPISQPEGVPLKVQDLKGQEWIFQFRFWPNNNSRMYVLEGIMPCIQSMQLQAGDIVTFSRIEPEGKLVMGCRKTSAASSDKGNSTCNPSLKSSLNGEAVHKGIKCGESANHGGLALPNFPMQGNAASPSLQPPKQQAAQPASTSYEEADKQGVVGQADSSARGKRKNSTVGLKRKRLRIDSEDVLELKVSWEQVQGLFRQPPNKIPTVFVIEGCEFEEFEAAPIIGRPTIPESDGHGKKVQWVQCEKCFKWRKIPADVLLKSKWTCSENLWDPARSVCSANEELTAEKLDTLLTTTSNAASEKMKDPMLDPESLEALEGLDALADLAIQEKATSSPPTSRHPRHKPGCSCIVCLQPPSGKGPKHKQPCDCVVCKSVKRRFETLMLKREQKQLEKEPESRSDKLHPEQSHEGSCKISSSSKTSKEEGSSDECPDNADKQCPASPLNDEIDLNIQPDRPELHPSASFHSVINTSKEWHLKQHIVSENIESSRSEPLLVDTKEMHQRQQGPSEYVKVTPVTQTQEVGTGNIDISTSTSLDSNHKSIAPAPKGIIISSTIPGGS